MRMLRWGALGVAIIGVGCFVIWAVSPRLPEYVERRQAVIDDRNVQMLIVELPTSSWHWSAVSDPSHPKTVQEWREELGADIVFNAAYFNEDFTPSGYFYEGKGTSTVPWPTAEQQADPHSYTFSVATDASGFHLAYLPTAPREEPTANTFLSFPTLVADGTPMVEENSYLYAARTVLAEDAEGRDFLIVTEKGSVTLYEIAQWLAAQPEQFVIAGNLDGGPSTGVSIEHGRWDVEEKSASVPSVIVGKRQK